MKLTSKLAVLKTKHNKPESTVGFPTDFEIIAF